MKLSEGQINDFIASGRIIIFNGSDVYDITNYTEHPGGVSLLRRKIGHDCKVDMMFHSKIARKLMKQYIIGQRQPQQSSFI